MDPVDLTIVIPAYREEENLRALLPRLCRTVAGLSAEVLVVDAVQPLDQTEAVCGEHNARHIRRRGGDAYGDAVRTGIAAARGVSIIFMDADGSHSPEFIPELLKYRGDYDVVVASRYVEGGGTENRATLKWMSKVLNLTYAVVLGIRCRDISNSFKLYPASQLKELDLRCANFDIVEEILFRLSQRNRKLKVKEIPYHFKTRLHGESKRNLLLFILSYLFTMVKLRLTAGRARRRDGRPWQVML